MAFSDQIAELDDRMRRLEARFANSGYAVQKIVHSKFQERFSILPQAETLFGMYTAFSVDTIDPLKQNRVRFFSPILHNKNTKIKQLPFAYPISAMGGFDDCGLNWVPPVGSTLCLIFEAGSRSSAYYIGTTWHRDRGPDGSGHNWNYNIEEYYKIHEGHRKGYNLGANDGSQVLPQWNTENYHGIDIDSNKDFDSQIEAQKDLTYANIYGFKTPQKHMMKMVDGDYKRSHRHKRIEILSSCGNWVLFKDDNLHKFDPDDKDIYFKDNNEKRPWNGPGTPQNNKCELPQSGIQMLSISGHSFLMDDQVEQPGNAIPEWERSLQSFDFGETDIFKGKTAWISATGHRIELNDEEEDTEIRSNINGIKLLSGCGNKIQLNDHSISKEASGSERGIHMQSTSNHTIDMTDGEELPQAMPRKEGGVPTPKAKKAFVKIRSGYGLEILMNDQASQEKTQSQHIQIFCPQKDNKTRGPHIMRFQEVPSGPGQVFLRVGGDYICSTYDAHLTVVGETENPSNKITMVTKNTIISTKEIYLNAADLHAFLAKKIILLMAGEDCPIPGSKEKGPCVWPVLCLTDRGIVISDRVFVSASPDASCASIFELLPFITCK